MNEGSRINHGESSAWPPYVCPEHGFLLSVEESQLRCSEAHAYPIVRQVPRFVSGANYADHFGAQWNRYRRTQLDSFSGTDISRKRIQRCLGDEIWNSLDDAAVLEVGCGAGRFTEILLQRGARVTSVDLSSAVEANRDNFGVTSHHRVVQANATALPFGARSFDVVLCLGVVQHPPSPENTIAALYRQVRPGGTLVFDHYAPSLSAYTKLTEPLLRRLLMRLPTDLGIRATEALVDVFLPAHRLAARIPGAQQLLSRVSPIRTYYHAYPQLGDSFQRDWAKLDTHDALTSWYRHTRRPTRLVEQLESLGAQRIDHAGADAFIEVRAVRPTEG